jgi:hypothetical protein
MNQDAPERTVVTGRFGSDSAISLRGGQRHRLAKSRRSPEEVEFPQSRRWAHELPARYTMLALRNALLQRRQ